MNLDVSTKKKNNKILRAIEQHSIHCVKEELQIPFSDLSDTFKETDLSRRAIHLLVKRPAGESINSRICSAVAVIVYAAAAPPQDLVQSSKGVSDIYVYL